MLFNYFRFTNTAKFLTNCQCYQREMKKPTIAHEYAELDKLRELITTKDFQETSYSRSKYTSKEIQKYAWKVFSFSFGVENGVRVELYLHINWDLYKLTRKVSSYCKLLAERTVNQSTNILKEKFLFQLKITRYHASPLSF